jgi:hypothetical protein
LAPLAIQSTEVEKWFLELRRGNPQRKVKPFADPTVDKVRRIMHLVYKLLGMPSTSNRYTIDGFDVTGGTGLPMTGSPGRNRQRVIPTNPSSRVVGNGFAFPTGRLLNRLWVGANECQQALGCNHASHRIESTRGRSQEVPSSLRASRHIMLSLRVEAAC